VDQQPGSGHDDDVQVVNHDDSQTYRSGAQLADERVIDE
jgi:hypothetical protein